MNQQRYRVDTGTIIDTKNGDILTLTQIRNQLNKYDNRLQDKDQLLKSTLEANEYQSNVIRNQAKQIIDIKNTIKTMMDNERTKLGYNALKQAYEAIQ